MSVGNAPVLAPRPHRPVPARRLSIVLTGTASDAHTWNLVFLQLLLEEAGHDVVNLGPCVPDEVVVASCVRRTPDLIVVSSVNGHGGTDGLRLIRVLREQRALADVPTIIGGKLGVAGHDAVGHTGRLLRAGFDVVFADDSRAVATLRQYVGVLCPGADR